MTGAEKELLKETDKLENERKKYEIKIIIQKHLKQRELDTKAQ